MNDIISLLSNLPFGGIGFGGLVTLAIVLIFRGDIVPRSTMEAARSTWEAMLIEKNNENKMLKEAYRMSEEARQIGSETDKELLELGRTTVHLLESIHKTANEVRT